MLYSLLCLIFISIFALPGCSEKKQKNNKENKAVPVTLGKSSARKVQYILNQVGTLEANQEVTIRSEIEGRVIEILFKEGQEVKKNDLLVRLNVAKINAEIAHLKGRVEQLRVRLANKKRTLDRKRPLVSQDLVSRVQFDDLQTEIKEIDAKIVQVHADLTLQKERLSDTMIRAPFDGIAGVRNFSEGYYLKKGDPIVTIVDLDPLEISFHVPGKYKINFFTGMEALLSVDSYSGRIFQGETFFISPQVDIENRTFHVKARVDNGRRLLNPGMFARVEVITEVHENALTVPWESIIQTEDDTYLYVIKGDAAHKVSVRLGKVTGEWAEILDTPLVPGSTVVLEGKFAVKEGAKVVVKQLPETGKPEGL